MTTAAIIQARMGSSRLPGKVLELLGKHTVLWHVLKRAALVPGIDVVVCAIPDDDANDAVAEAAINAGATVVRGSEHDVLARYLAGARTVNASRILRITSDCPLIDPELAGQVLACLDNQAADYASNNSPPGFPHGLDCEAFTRHALEKANIHAVHDHEREHVTPWLRNADSVARAHVNCPYPGYSGMRWTLDYPEDLAFLRAIFELMPDQETVIGWRDVAALIQNHPEVAAINARHAEPGRQHPQRSGS